jgi:dTMP kinase
MRGLEFPESRAMAKKLNPLARYFRHELEMVPDLTLMEKRGAYIVLEGISGSGKDTQAQELLLHFNELGFMTHMVQEPTPFYKETRQFWDSYRQEPWWQAFLLMADRFRLIRTEVEPSLNRGETVISVRSYLSTVAHQGRRAGERELFELAHRFVPPIDLVFILDLPAEVARNRCLARAMAENRLIGDHETTEMLDATRWEYLKLRESHAYEDFVVVDADRAPEVIQKEIQLELEKRGYLNLYSATGGNPTG